ncbi:MAG: hypothetical protein JNM68_11215 [Dinghuibacter sp.]|nr:hypothetical protein [Dinghuibacter sp.]
MSITVQPSSKAVYIAIVCFLTYASVYAFRKPFTVGMYPGESPVWGIQYKSMLIICQVVGYMFSKFYGIHYIGGLRSKGRIQAILLLIGSAWLSLLLFAVTPAPYNIIFLFTNGFPLGLIWGLLFSYVEGRRATDFIGPVLAVSFIFSSGFVKTIAAALQKRFLIPDMWLPFLTGAVFILPLLLFLWLLNRVPGPDSNDVAHRTERIPMSREERRALVKKFLPGLLLLVLVYVFLTIFRDLRDNFAADMWVEAGFSGNPSKFVATEIPVTLTVLAVTTAMVLVKNNYRAFLFSMWMIILGLAISGGASFLYMVGGVSFFNWMLLSGMGLYLGYIPYNSILFERMIAAFRITGNVGFLMYLADASGYLGSVLVTLAKNWFRVHIQWIGFYTYSVVFFSLVAIPATLSGIYYFTRKNKLKDHE